MRAPALLAVVLLACGRDDSDSTRASRLVGATAPDSVAVETTVTGVDTSRLVERREYWTQVDTVILPPDDSLPPTASCDSSMKGDLQFYGQFEQSAPFRDWNLNEADASPHKHAYSTEHVSECAGAVRVELRKSDPLEASSHRSEIKIQADSANGGVAGTIRAGVPGTETWFGWSIYVPSDFVFETAGGEQETVTQIKACTTGRSPVWEIQIDKGTFEVNSRWGREGALKIWISQPPHHPGIPITKGAWHHFVLHGKWRGDSTGVLELWMNGTKYVDRQNVPTVWSDCSGGMQSSKVGIYKWSWEGSTSSIVDRRVLWFDSVRMTDGAHGSYATVAPRPRP